jgi:hypothetical protein
MRAIATCPTDQHLARGSRLCVPPMAPPPSSVNDSTRLSRRTCRAGKTPRSRRSPG